MARKKQPDYTLGTWKGRDQFRCTRCPYDTLHEKDMETHLRQRHRVREPRQSVPTERHDRFGNVVGKETN